MVSSGSSAVMLEWIVPLGLRSLGGLLAILSAGLIGGGTVFSKICIGEYGGGVYGYFDAVAAMYFRGDFRCRGGFVNEHGFHKCWYRRLAKLIVSRTNSSQEFQMKANHYFRLSIILSEASLTTSRKATTLAVGGKKIPSSLVENDGVSAFLALINLLLRRRGLSASR